MNANRRSRILVVDDEAEFMRALCEGLGDQGYEATGAADPLLALDALRLGRFDLLLVDAFMPGMNGVQFLRQAQAIDPKVIAVVMTGEASQASAREAAEAGAVEYVAKPFKLAALLPVLERAMDAATSAK